MSNSKNHREGYSLIELVLVMALLVIFGLTTFTLVVSGGEAYKNIIGKKDANSELRVALSYVNMRIRQNDSQGSIRLERSPNGGHNAVVIQELIEGSSYETWIYWEDGRLREAFVSEGQAVTKDISFVVADIDGFEARYGDDNRSIQVKVWRDEKGIQKDYSSWVFLKSAK